MTDKKTTFVKAINQANQIREYYLHLEGDERLPIVLGTGRNAVVFLATTTSSLNSIANSYHAIKFLRDDIDKQYARASAERFFQEAAKVKTFDLLQGTFVRYFGWGAIGRPGQLDEKGDLRDYWWDDQFIYHKDQLVNDAEDDELSRLRTYYNLQGPFYVLELCQGTLHDLLEKKTLWSSLPPYSVSNFKSSLLAQQERIGKDIDDIANKYLLQHPVGRSGYDILNSFDKENPHANKIRSRAVLEIFRQIAYTVSQLHKKKNSVDPNTHEQKITDPLAHRDLKPGNIFFKHDANVDGLNHISIQLSDLGYVTNIAQIESGDMTMRAGQKGIEYQAPGSQFFRAPEQSELPIEVRVDIISDRVVRITGSKVERIEPQDWIVISDIFSEKKNTTQDQAHPPRIDPKIFKINRVTHHKGGYGEENADAYYELELDEPVITSRKEDLQGQINRATGFQTDGFSLGAILYDLISGGRNPELFYTYCIVSLISQLKPGDSIKAIVDILCPEEPESLSVTGYQNSGAEDLNLAERRKMMEATVEADTLDDLLQRILEAAFHKENFVPRKKLSYTDKLKITNLLRKIPDIDNLIITLLDSSFFKHSLSETDTKSLDDILKASLDQQLKNYRFRNFDLVKRLLEDRRGEKIPRDILQIIVSCMIRDVEGSYYKRDVNLGFLTDSNFDATTRIHDEVQRLLSEPQYRLPDTGFPKSLEDNLLFKLRSLARHPGRSTIPHAADGSDSLSGHTGP